MMGPEATDSDISPESTDTEPEMMREYGSGEAEGAADPEMADQATFDGPEYQSDMPGDNDF